MIAVLIASALAALYVGAATWKNKAIPDSISAMVYELPRNWQFLWILWMWAIAFLIYIPVIDVLSEKGMEWVGFLTLTSFAFTGAMPLVKKSKNTSHYVMAIISGILSQICVCLICKWWICSFSLLFFIHIIMFSEPDKKICRLLDGKAVFIIEMICSFNIVLSYILNCYQ